MRAKLPAMKIVGSLNRSEIETNPLVAWQRGRAMDAMLRGSLPPCPRGVWRLTHAQMNVMDFERQLAQATRVNRQVASQHGS